MKKILKTRFIGMLLINLFLLNPLFSQVGITNSGMTQEQERNQASKGFDYGNKSGSALKQLEQMTGQKVSTYNSNTQQYSQQRVSTPTLSFEQQMNIMVTGMIAQSIITSIFSANNTAPKVQVAKSNPATLMGNTSAENQKIQNTLLFSKHQKMMELYKLLYDEKNMEYKSVVNLSMGLKSYLTQEDMERQNLINKGISVTWDYNSWAQIAPNNNKIVEQSTPYEKTNADNYLDEAINKIETLPNGVGRVAAVAGRFVVNIKDESMSYLKDASNAIVSGDISKMNELGQYELRKITNNALKNTGKQTLNAYVEQGKDALKGFVDEKLKETNFALMESGGLKLLEKYKIYAPVYDAWKVPLRKY